MSVLSDLEKVARETGWKSTPSAGDPKAFALYRSGGFRILVLFSDHRYTTIQRAVFRPGHDRGPIELLPSFETISDLMREERP